MAVKKATPKEKQGSQTLKIVIKGEYFDAIASKTKKVEYREESPFWYSRLFAKNDKKDNIRT